MLRLPQRVAAAKERRKKREHTQESLLWMDGLSNVEWAFSFLLGHWWKTPTRMLIETSCRRGHLKVVKPKVVNPKKKKK